MLSCPCFLPIFFFNLPLKFLKCHFNTWLFSSCDCLFIGYFYLNIYIYSNGDDKILSVQKVRQIIVSSRNNIDKFIEVFCNSLGIKYKKCSESEKEVFRKLLKKSPSIKNSGIIFRRKK